MRTVDLLYESVAALRGNRVRTVLTGLGITVGTVALVLILSLSRGLTSLVDEMVSGESQLRQVVVMPGFGAPREKDDVPEVVGEMSDAKRVRLRRALKKRSRTGPRFQMRTVLIDDAARDELSALPGVVAARPFVQERLEVAAEGAEPRVGLSLGVPAEGTQFAERLLAGRWFESDDERGVVVHELFLYHLGFTTDAVQSALVGRDLRVTVRKSAPRNALTIVLGTSRPRVGQGEVLHEESLPILGVVRERYEDMPASWIEEGWAMQTDLFLAIDRAEALWRTRDNGEGLAALLLETREVADVERVEEAARERGLRVQSVRRALERIEQFLGTATIVAGFLAGIAVFVSALGIVNTMVMSVVERTREIGLLKALGATGRDVVALFLVEGALLGLAGGIVGVVFARVLGALGNKFGAERLQETFQAPVPGELFRFPLWLYAGALGFAVVVSLLASVAPALRAARIDPVRALRHE